MYVLHSSCHSQYCIRLILNSHGDLLNSWSCDKTEFIITEEGHVQLPGRVSGGARLRTRYFPSWDDEDVFTGHESKFPRHVSDSVCEWLKWMRDRSLHSIKYEDLTSLLWVMSTLGVLRPRCQEWLSGQTMIMIKWTRNVPRRRVEYPRSQTSATITPINPKTKPT